MRTSLLLVTAVTWTNFALASDHASQSQSNNPERTRLPITKDQFTFSDSWSSAAVFAALYTWYFEFVEALNDLTWYQITWLLLWLCGIPALFSTLVFRGSFVAAIILVFVTISIYLQPVVFPSSHVSAGVGPHIPSILWLCVTPVLVVGSACFNWIRQPCVAIAMAIVITIFGSLVSSLWISRTYHDVSGGFTVGAYILAAGSMPIGFATYRHSGNCSCWKKSKDASTECSVADETMATNIP